MDSDDTVSSDERERRIASPAGQRLIEAMRLSIGRRGIASSTFDRIAPEADVSRGSIAWYFGTKERLLTEVMRADADARLERMREELGAAASLEELIAASRRMLDEFLDAEERAHVVSHEIGSLAVQNGAIGETQRELRRRWRRSLADILELKASEGAIALPGGPETTASLLTALAYGLASEAMADPEWDRARAEVHAADMARLVFSPG